MRLYLIRHGQTDSNARHVLDTAHPGAPLDAVGLAQAEALAERMADVELEAVYSSDLTRAVQTATPLATQRGLSVRQLPGLREISAGDEEYNEDWTVYLDVLRSWRTDRSAKLPGGEDADVFLARYDAAIAEIAAAHTVAALVSHGAALRVWVGQQCPDFPADDDERHRLGNTAAIVLEGSPEQGWTIISWAGQPVSEQGSSQRP